MDYRNITIAFLVCALPLAQSIVSIVVDASQHNNGIGSRVAAAAFGATAACCAAGY
jgi:hypothetical protein